jgi:large subunit ribosomal protein L6
MSRIGKQVIPIPEGTTVTVKGLDVEAKGSHGTLKLTLNESVQVEIDNGQLIVKNATGLKEDRKYHGLYRALLHNIVVGVSTGFTKNLELVGVGYRASVQDKDLVLEVGYSNPVKVAIPAGLKTTCGKPTVISIWGIDKQQVGQFAAIIRDIRPPEPYKGKGIKYEKEVIRRKAGKTGAVGQGS